MARIIPKIPDATAIFEGVTIDDARWRRIERAYGCKLSAGVRDICHCGRGNFFTLNECATFVELGHATGVFAPGLKLPPGRVNQVQHHALLAHGLPRLNEAVAPSFGVELTAVGVDDDGDPEDSLHLPRRYMDPC